MKTLCIILSVIAIGLSVWTLKTAREVAEAVRCEKYEIKQTLNSIISRMALRDDDK